MVASRKSGQAVVELTLLIPWLVFSFVAAFNFGIFAYALISTQNAARSGAVYASQSLAVAQGGAVGTQVCTYVLGELGDAPGVSGVSTCTAAPVTVYDHQQNGLYRIIRCTYPGMGTAFAHWEICALSFARLSAFRTRLSDFGTRPVLLVAQGGHGVKLRRAARGQEAGGGRDQRQQQGSRYQGERIVRLQPE